MRRYKYGMRFRGYSPGCQPMDGLVGTRDDGHYHTVLFYDRKLSEKEIIDYELDYIGVQEVQDEITQL